MELVQFSNKWDKIIGKLRHHYLVLHKFVYAVGCVDSFYKPSLRSNDTLCKQIVVTLGWGKTDKTEQTLQTILFISKGGI